MLPRSLMLVSLIGLSSVASIARGEPALDHFTRLSWCELESLYRQAKPGPLPCGFAQGRVIYCPHQRLAGLSGRVAKFWWKGKHFDPCRGIVINQWAAGKAVRARMCYGTSRVDGQPSILLDYTDSWPSWRGVRDELREIGPGLYLGAMFVEDALCPKVFFVLQFTGN